MATLIRPELSEKNKYWIDKHRHYELKHFCLQYPIWKNKYNSINSFNAASIYSENFSSSNIPGNPTMSKAINRSYYSEKIKMIEQTAKESDPVLYSYILKAVTEDRSYVYLKSQLDIPCGKDLYYDRYRRFFWLLNKKRG